MGYGKKFENGLYPGISNEEYHAADGASKSDLVLVRRSPAHYFAAKLADNRQPQETTPAMALGTAVHYAIFEPDVFLARYSLSTCDDRRLKEWKEQAASAEEAGKTLLKLSEAEQINAMALAVRSHPQVAPLLESGAQENSIFWDFEGAQLKTRPDWTAHTDVIVDLKTTEDARPEHWARHACNLYYPEQAAMQLDGFEAHYGERARGFMWVVVEKAPPHAILVYEPTEEMLDYGRRRYYQDARAYRECRESGIWPGYNEEILPLYLPAFAQREYDEMVEAEL